MPRSANANTGQRIAIGAWEDPAAVEEIGESLHRELAALGHRPRFFRIDGGEVPACDVVLLHGPRGRFVDAIRRAHGLRPRPKVVVWNTQGLPDPRLPWSLTKLCCRLRRHAAADARLMRFDFLGQYLEAAAAGWIDAFFDISAVYARRLSRIGMPVHHVPFGSMAGSWRDLALERDIDVLWIGKRATRRRGRMLDRLRADLGRRGIGMHVVDNVEQPFVFGEERTRLLNRSKITLNLLRTWYDENSMRLCLAAPNRSLVISETLLPHVPAWEPGVHYVASPVPRLADAIEAYLGDDGARRRLTDEAFRLATSTLTFGASVSAILRRLEGAL